MIAIGRRMPALLARLVVVVLMLVLAGASVTAVAGETRVALVIGVGAYQSVPTLANPVADARAIGESLQRLGFEVEELYDPDLRALTRGVRAFGVRAQAADVAVVYYAGHGVQVDRENYLLPADARLERQRDLLYEALPLANLLGEVSQAAKIGIVLLDACRNNPFVDRMARSIPIAGRALNTDPGLARVDNVPRNTMVVMATKADQTAEDGGDHSPFASALLAHFQIPGLELSLFFRSVRDAVLRATANRQEPYVFSSLGAEPFYFYPRPPNHPPQIGPISRLDVLDTSGPVPLGLPRPTDPDQDPLTMRIIGLPIAGEVRVDGRVVTPNAMFSLDKFATATFKPDGRMLGPVGTLDVLIEDGRGGTATASLPITVLSSNHPPVVEAARTARAYPTLLGIAAPSDPDGDPLTVTVLALPHGLVRNGAAALKVGDRMAPQDLAGLSFVPDAGVVGDAGSLRYLVEDGRGGSAEGRLEVEVADAGEIVSEERLWAGVRQKDDAGDVDAFLRLFPGSRFAAAARQRHDELARRRPTDRPTDRPADRPMDKAGDMAAARPASRPAGPPPAVEAPAPPPEPGKQFALLQPPRAAPAPALAPAVPAIVVAPPAMPPPAAAAPMRGGGGEARIQDCPNCPVLARISDGSFTMGQGAREPEAAPPHRVALRGFALGLYPVTLGEWKSCMAEGGCNFLPRMASADDRVPIHNVSWDDTQQFLTWLSRKTGRHYRLPSEAEWEYAARAGTAGRYWWGNEIGATLVNCADCGGHQDAHAPLPVDAYPPNAFGLADMLGGVAQWVADCWAPSYQGAPADGTARDSRSCLKRVLRGGSFRARHDDITVTARDSYDTSVRYFVNGMRVARDLN